MHSVTPAVYRERGWGGGSSHFDEVKLAADPSRGGECWGEARTFHSLDVNTLPDFFLFFFLLSSPPPPPPNPTPLHTNEGLVLAPFALRRFFFLPFFNAHCEL